MAKAMAARITGTGMFVPPKVVKNTDLEKLMDTSDEWIRERSGIIERRYAEEGVGPSDLAIEASKQALEAAGRAPGEIDLVIAGTLAPDYYFPGIGVFIQDGLGMGTTPALDVRNQCSGFLYGLSIARSFILAGQYKRILVVGAEVHSSALNFSTEGRDVTVLFGDGAGAAVVEASPDPEHGILSVHLHSEGKYRDALKIEAPTTRKKPSIDKSMFDDLSVYPYMEGRNVFKHAVTRMPEAVDEALEANHLQPNDIDLFLFHQANLRINEMVMKRMDQPMEKSYNNIEKYGNCSAASIPMCLDEAVRQDRVKPGDLLCMASFGAGYTWASAIIRW